MISMFKVGKRRNRVAEMTRRAAASSILSRRTFLDHNQVPASPSVVAALLFLRRLCFAALSRRLGLATAKLDFCGTGAARHLLARQNFKHGQVC
jgi:hypothetical protein